MFEGTNESLHVQLRVNVGATEVGEADFDFVTQFRGFFFSLRDAVFVAVGKFDGDGAATEAAFGWAPESSKDFGEIFEVETAEFEGAGAGFQAGNPGVGAFFHNGVGDGAGQDLNPEFFGVVGVELREGASDTGQGVNFEVVEGFNRENFVVGQRKFGGVGDGVETAEVNIVLFYGADLDGGVLGVNLSLDERLESFRDPDIKTDLSRGGNDFKAQVFLDSVVFAELGGVAENTVQRGEHLFGGKLFFIVGAGDFERQKDGFNVQSADFGRFFIIQVGQDAEQNHDRNPDDWFQEKLEYFHISIITQED